jgi:hypothetical protein
MSGLSLILRFKRDILNMFLGVGWIAVRLKTEVCMSLTGLHEAVPLLPLRPRVLAPAGRRSGHDPPRVRKEERTPGDGFMSIPFRPKSFQPNFHLSFV